MNLFDAYQIAFSTVFSLMAALWLCSLILKDASIIDRFWGFGFVLIAWVLALLLPAQALSTTQTLMVVIVSIWGIRLSLYIHFRNQGHGEDYRYQEMRQHHGKNFWWYSFLSVFSLQGILMLIVSAPLVVVMSQPQVGEFTAFGIAGSVLWLVGFIFEAGGDWQLSSFKKNPANKGQLLRTGLWSLTRHPNYFGDSLQWWGFGCIALPYGTIGALSLVGPLVMTLFIRKVSGVDLLEKSLSNSKPGYQEYIASTPPFFPVRRFWITLIILVLAALLIFKFIKIT